MKHLWFLLVFSALSFAQTETTPQPQLTEVPPQPTCAPILPNGPCADLWRAYGAAVMKRQNEEVQLDFNRQMELAARQATAPLQQQIDSLNKLVTDQQAQIKKMSDQMQADAIAAIQARNEAHSSGLRNGILIGAVGMVVLLVLVFGIRKFAQSFSS